MNNKQSTLLAFSLITSLFFLWGFAHPGNGGQSLCHCAFFGYVSDVTSNIQNGYIIPFSCFVVIALFGYKGHRIRAADLQTKAAPVI